MALIPYAADAPPTGPVWWIAPEAIARVDNPQPLLEAMAVQPLTAAERAQFARAAIVYEQRGRCRMDVLRTLTAWLKEP